MASETVRDLLTQIVGIHRRLAEIYGQLAESTDRPRVALLVQYMAKRESRLADAVGRYEHDEDSGPTLDYWFKATPVMPDELCLDDLRLPPGMTTDEFSTFSLAIDTALAAFVRRLSEGAETVAVRELFTDLLEQEEREQRESALAAMEVERDM